MKYIKNLIKQWQVRKKFPLAVLYDNVQIDKSSTIGDYSVLFADTILICSSVGAYSYVQRGTIICNAVVGSYCSVAGGVNIGLAAHPTHMISTSPVFYDNTQPLPAFLVDQPTFNQTLPRTTIGADVWIGQSAMIKAGVTIGAGAVIGAGSIVTKDVPPYSIIGGIPARLIRMRFEDDIVKGLLDSKWWEIDVAKLKEVASSFNDPKTFLKKLQCTG